MKRPFASVAIKRAEISQATRVNFIKKFAFTGPGQCWEWLASKTPQGYGRFMLPGQGSTTAQRVAYAIFVGDLPAGLTVDHLCGNPSCVRPEHLDAVPHAVNIRRGRTSACAVNARKKTCPQGHPYALYDGPNHRQRYCPICKRDKGREWMRRRRGSDPARYRV